MAFAAIIDGRVIIHWFEEGTRLNQYQYLDMLQNVLWPQIEADVEQYQYWFQQDGATCHTTDLVLNWLAFKFGHRVISNKFGGEAEWPPHSPDKSPLDYWLWGASEQEVRRVKPQTLDELKEVVTDYVESLSEEEVRKAVKNTSFRAEMCLQVQGGHFEHLLQKEKRRRRNAAAEE